MKKFLFTILFAAFTAGITAQTATITVSTSVESPENMYTLKNGNGLYMTAYTSPTSLNPARFAFYAVDGVEDAYYIYSVDKGQWVSYAQAESYSNRTNFATFVDSKDDAACWNAVIVQYNSVDYYQIAPYKTTGVASIYLNWLYGTGSNPLDNTTTTIGLYGTGASGDAGSRWILEAATDLADEASITAAKSLVKTTVGYPATTSAAYSAMTALTYGSTTAKALELAKAAYLAVTDIILPEEGKAYTIANKAYDGTLRYITYTNGSKPSLATSSSDGAVFVCKEISNNVFAFVTSDGNVLTWVGNNETGAYNEDGVYGYSSYYATEHNGKTDWNNITLVKQNVGDAETILGTICMQARRHSSSSSSFIVKTTENRFDQAGTTHFFDETFSSAFIFTEVEHTNSEAQEAALAKIGVKINGKTIGEEIGLYHFSINGEKATNYTPIDEATTAEEVNTISESISLNIPEAGKFYRLKNVASSNYMSGNASTVTLLADGSSAASTIFYVGKNNTLLSYNSGLYLDCKGRGYAAIGTSYNGAFGVAYGGCTANVIMYKNNGYWTYGADSDGGNLDRGSGTPNHRGYNWTVEEVTELPVTISTAGYATFYTPVAVTIPSDEVEAYAVSSINGEYADLTAFTTTIPAGTGVILKAKNELSEATTFSFAKTEDAGTETANELDGTAAVTELSESNTTYYILANGTNGVGFYADGMANGVFRNNAFKAYLPVATDNSLQAASYSFRFDGTGTTGIDAIATSSEKSNSAIYDLTGRRVNNATTPGIYIIDGKKVVIK